MAVLKNFMEDLVEQNLDKIIKSSGGCLCEKCRLDTMAIVLNKMPNKYAVTEKGEVYTKLSVLQQQFDVDVVSNIVQASMLVAKSPRHTQEDLDALAKQIANGER